MSVFLTPDLKPFFGGTYFPPDDRYGRPGFLSLLRQIAEIWQNRKEEIVTSARDIHLRLTEATAVPATSKRATLDQEVIRQAGMIFRQAYDPQYGGFGRAPKFPQPSTPQLLLRYARRFNDEEAARMVLHTCDQMAAGGIHDQLGGGFSRYAVDARWLVPHFEKMLYDNAQLAQLYLDAFVLSGEARHADVVCDILDYVLRDMTHPQGGFYSAEDADSEGHEGKFYCWTLDELSGLLTPEEYNVAVKYFGLTKEGNFVDHSHPQPLSGQNVISVVDPALPQMDQPLLASAQEKMRVERATRVRPHLDDKVLASWNGLMLGAFARASIVLSSRGPVDANPSSSRPERYLEAAERNLKFLRENLWDDKTKTLYHRWRNGDRDNVQLLEAYAFLLGGVIDLYEATLRPDYLAFAVSVADSMVDRFHDRECGGFWHSAAHSGGGPPSDLILRLKDEYDGAEPSGNSVAALSLLKLGSIAGRPDFTEAAEKTLHFFSERLEQSPQAVSFLLQALDFHLQEPKRVAVAGSPARVKTRELLRAAHSVYEPNKVVTGTEGPVEAFARTLPAAEAKIYLCVGAACQAPTDDPEKVRQLLRAPAQD